MILKTKEFQDACKNILLAARGSNSNLELAARDSALYLNVTNGSEYYVAVRFPLDTFEDFRAVVEATQFLDLIAGITTETFDLSVKDNTVVVKHGKSLYKLPMIFENDQLATLTPIFVIEKTVEMPISKEILNGILKINGRIIDGVKKDAKISELKKQYFIDETGCYTFAVGACVNKFTLEKPVKMLLNDRIIKLTKLFKSDVQFTLGQGTYRGEAHTIAVFETADVYLAALITNDDELINTMLRGIAAAKGMFEDNYPDRVVLSANTLGAALNRLMQFTKNSTAGTDNGIFIAQVDVTGTDVTFTAVNENTEVVPVEADSVVSGCYSTLLNLQDVKLVVNACQPGEFITLNCGNYQTVTFTHGDISNLIPVIIKKAG